MNFFYSICDFYTAENNGNKGRGICSSYLLHVWLIRKELWRGCMCAGGGERYSMTR